MEDGGNIRCGCWVRSSRAEEAPPPPDRWERMDDDDDDGWRRLLPPPPPLVARAPAVTRRAAEMESMVDKRGYRRSFGGV